MADKVMIGLEIHIQLRGQKLFCSCPTESVAEGGKEFNRRLVATTGESGRYDPAAVYEKSRSRSFSYVISDNSCLLEADEEPPHAVNREVLLKGVAVSLALNCRVVDEVSYMRKIVIDGSNTSGFQRTAIVGFNGYVETSKGRVGISSICLEEDSARKISEEKGNVVYSLDRLGVPLLEIATDPDIVDENHAVETAEIIGKKLLLAGWARKAPDAIRQDVNFSMGHGRVEIKGVPKLSTIRDAISFETERQRWIIELAPRLKGLDFSRFSFSDVTETFSKTNSRMIAKSISSGQRVYGTVLPGLSGLLRGGDYRMGRELADVAKLFGSGGIMHSDELPGYGVEKELPQLEKLLSPGKGDGYMVIVSTPEIIPHIEKAMKDRLTKLSNLDFPETRVVAEDGTTHYLRPLPGGERMYPETDIQLIPVDEELLRAAAKIAPRSEEEMLKEIREEFGISGQDASVILQSGKRNELSRYTDALSNSRLAARLILQTIPELEKKRNGPVNDEEIMPLLVEAGLRKWDRQVLETALNMLICENMPLEDILASEELNPLGADELRTIVAELIKSGEISQKNIVPRIRSVTRRTFDPAEAIRILAKLKS